MDYLHRNKHTFLQSYGEKARREAEVYGNTAKEDHVQRYLESSTLLLPGTYPILSPVDEGGWYCQEGYLHFLQTSKINAGPALGHSWLLCYFVRPAHVPTSHLQTAPGRQGASRGNLCVLEAEFASTHAGCSMPVGNIPWHR